MSDKPNGHGVALDFSTPATDTSKLDGAQILNDVQAFIRRFVVLSEPQSVAVALWAAHTYVFNAAIWTPYLAITSATKRCGKSRLLETVSYIVRKPWSTSNATPAALFREIDKRQPTLLLDETDALFKADKEMAQAVRGILNAGAHYKGMVSRVVGKGTDLQTKDFRVYCPKALSGIGFLPDTVADRSLHIRLERKLPGQKVERLREKDVFPQAAPLCERLAEWTGQEFAGLREAKPALPEELNDRQQDGAEILLAVADAGGADWPVKARRTLIELCSGEAAGDDSIDTQLLADIKNIFEADAVDRLPSADLVARLVEIETSPWKEWSYGKPLTPVSLSRRLKPFGIAPRTIRLTDNNPSKGYLRESFEEVWIRYLSPTAHIPAFETLQPLQVNVHAGPEYFSDPLQSPIVTDEKSDKSPMFTRVVTDVTDQTTDRAPKSEQRQPANDPLCLCAHPMVKHDRSRPAKPCLDEACTCDMFRRAANQYAPQQHGRHEGNEAARLMQ